jgi:hypothetical protein
LITGFVMELDMDRMSLKMTLPLYSLIFHHWEYWNGTLCWVPFKYLRHMKLFIAMVISGAECSACGSVILCRQFSDISWHCAVLCFAWCYGK